ncbi:MAG: hypothetical protein LBJ08_10145 [Bifidobacteriaceae bacterium]|jgi:hypothetical protein|nr:hypothetical protein [Bifidobacteriaceae bacterium]
MGKRSRRSRRAAAGHPPLDVERARGGFAVRESAADGDWMVRAAGPASKTYICPGCGQEIPPGNPSIVVWQADGLLGEETGVAGRRHWHPACWRERVNRR